MAGKEETPTCRKKTVTRTNEMIEDLIDFIEIDPIVAFEAIHEPILTSARDTTNKMAFLGGEEGASLCIALLCTIVLRRRLSSKKRSIWAREWLRRRRWDVFL
jgi:hypothetical protein